MDAIVTQDLTDPTGDDPNFFIPEGTPVTIVEDNDGALIVETESGMWFSVEEHEIRRI